MDRGFRRIVVGLLLRTVDDEPRHGADVDDGAGAPVQHPGPESPAAPEDTVQVDVDHLVPHRVRHGFGRVVRDRDSRIVDEDVDPAVPGDNRVLDMLDGRRIRDVEPLALDTMTFGPTGRRPRARGPGGSCRVSTTVAPASASASAIARPMPRAAPVTTATRPSNLNFSRYMACPPGVGRSLIVVVKLPNFTRVARRYGHGSKQKSSNAGPSRIDAIRFCCKVTATG